MVLGFLALAISADAGGSMHNPFYCYATDPIRPMTSMGGVITSYEAVRRFNFTTVNPYVSSEVCSFTGTVKFSLITIYCSLYTIKVLVSRQGSNAFTSRRTNAVINRLYRIVSTLKIKI